MLYLTVLFVCICIILCITYLFSTQQDFFNDKILVFIFGVFACFLFCLLSVSFIPILGGLFPNYSNGQRTGYITKISNKGLIFKTTEGEMQVGVGEQASLQEPFQFSVVDGKITQQLYQLEGSGIKVTLLYDQWYISPAWIGDSSYVIKEIRVTKAEQEK